MAFIHGYLKNLEAESIYILREIAAEFARPVLLYSIGKDSSVLLHLSKKAFYPSRIPFDLLHVYTGYKFPEMYEFRNWVAQKEGLQVKVKKNERAIESGANPHDLGRSRCCSLLKTKALLDALNDGGYDCAIGGARRDEEKSRAKERIFSFRDKYGQWNPRKQRPEIWKLFNTKLNQGESIRVFPLSNWTELNIWHYILVENIDVVPLYFAKERKMVISSGILTPYLGSETEMGSEEVKIIRCRYRSLGCMPCSGAVRSDAANPLEIIEELMRSRISERSARMIDFDQDCSMELKKREGYF